MMVLCLCAGCCFVKTMMRVPFNYDVENNTNTPNTTGTRSNSNNNKNRTVLNSNNLFDICQKLLCHHTTSTRRRTATWEYIFFLFSPVVKFEDGFEVVRLLSMRKWGKINCLLLHTTQHNIAYRYMYWIIPHFRYICTQKFIQMNVCTL